MGRNGSKKIAQKFGFSEREVENWRDQPFCLKGEKSAGVVLVHGWTAMPRQTKPLAKALNRAGYHIYAPRLTGHGSAPEDLERVGCDEWVKDVSRAVLKLQKNPEINQVFLVGISLGGNISAIVATRLEVNGLVLVGTPVHIKNHFFLRILAGLATPFRKYFKKKHSERVSRSRNTYQYFPLKSVKETFRAIKKSLASFKKLEIPVLILQTSKDYLVTKYSPWIIFNSLKTEEKQLEWIKSEYNNHVITDSELPDSFASILRFIEKNSKDHKKE
jgi:carboxylesterase